MLAVPPVFPIEAPPTTVPVSPPPVVTFISALEAAPITASSKRPVTTYLAPIERPFNC